MVQYLFSGGISIIPIGVSLIVIIFISFKNLKIAFHVDKIILIGPLTGIFGILMTGISINNAIKVIPDISKVAPFILWNGLKTSLVTTFSGGFVLWLSVLLWYIFKNRYKLHI